MNRLWQIGFNGTFEFIYPDNGTNKVIMLFDLPKDIPSVYEYVTKQKKKITFIKISEYIQRLISGTVKPIPFGITGAYDSQHMSECSEISECKKYADNFASFTQYIFVNTLSEQLHFI